MIARILLFGFGCLLLVLAARGIVINITQARGPVLLSAAQLQAAGASPPRWVKLTSSAASDGVCVQSVKTGEEGQTGEVDSEYAIMPILTEAQSDALAAGRKVSVSTFVRFDGCKGDHDLPQTAGLTDVGASELSDKTRAWLAGQNIVVADRQVVLRSDEEPPTTQGAVWGVVLGLIFCAVPLVPFLNRERPPSAEELADKTNAQVVTALFPVLKVHGDGADEDLPDMRRAALDTSKERVLLRVNAQKTGHPVLLVITNRRYMVFQMQRDWVGAGIKLLGKAVEKIPVGGGLASVMLEPFEEAWEVLAKPHHRSHRRAMSFEEAELLSDKPPCRCSHQYDFDELVRRTKSIEVKPATWKNALKLEFEPRSLRDILAMPPDVQLTPTCAQLAFRHLAILFATDFPALGEAISDTKNGGLRIDWPDEAAAAA